MNIVSIVTPRAPVEEVNLRNKLRRWVTVLLLLSTVGIYFFWRFVPSTPHRYANIVEHFKYGSIGGESATLNGHVTDEAGTKYVDRGLPYWLWLVLPEMFPEHLPEGSSDYSAFGMLYEPGWDRPIGFSRRRTLGVELIGLNCAICHTAAVQFQEGQKPLIYPGAPSHTVNLQGFFRFLFACAKDPRFRVGDVLARIKTKTSMDWLDELMLERAISRFRESILSISDKLKYWDRFPDNGPGRIDTFGPYQVLFFNMPAPDHPGVADFPPLWNQAPREGLKLHWDGNNESLLERNISASLGAGATPQSLDHASLKRVAEWVKELPAPQFPKEHVNEQLAMRGKPLYQKHCASCHDFGGSKTGTIEPIEALGTDPARWQSFSPPFVERVNTLGSGYFWKFTHFKKTEGYANLPLDGVWLRAPYLHNGSVPNLWTLLTPGERPTKFFRGNPQYDVKQVGFVHDKEMANGRKLPTFETNLPGNRNTGHTYGQELTKEEKYALIEYLKKL